MNPTRMILCLILLIVAVIGLSGQAYAEPVLIKLNLEKPGDWSNAMSLGVVAFHRSEDFVLAEFETARLDELEAVGLKYEIIDEEPWSAEYFLTFPTELAAEVDLESYGKTLLTDPKWQLIKASREEASELMKKGYRVIPIRRKAIPLKYKPPLKAPKPALEYSADIDSLLNLVSEDSLHAWVQRLQDFQTRYSYSDSIGKARDWLRHKFLSFGIDSVWLHHFNHDSDQWNVVAAVEGTARPDRVIVVGGHYDSVVYGPGTNPYEWAPGADDNASGTVATLEMARIVAQNPLPITVIFAAFAQEEQGLIGSDYLAQYLHNQNTALELMINSDMISYNPNLSSDVRIYGDPTAMDYINLMMEVADTYTYLNPVYMNQAPNSDHYSFYQWGYDAIMAHEPYVQYHNTYHSDYDVVDSLDFPYLKEAVGLCLATALAAGNSPSPVQNLRAMDAGDGEALYLSWSENHPAEDVVSYSVYFGTASGYYDSIHQVTCTCDTLRNLEENVTYFMTVTAVNANGYESVRHDEISLAPSQAPRPPTGLVVRPFGTYKIKLDWAPNQEVDLDYYNIYRSEQSGSGYQLLSGACRETTFVDSSVQGEVDYYYYTLTAVDTTGNESAMSQEVEGAAVTLDQGILVLDETYEDIAYNMVNSDSINAFYERALQAYTHAHQDHSCPNCYPLDQVRLSELGRYSVVIVHSEDHRGNRSLGARGDSTYLILRKYLEYGGKVIIEGRRNLSAGDDGDWIVRNFSPRDVPYDYLQVKSAYNPPWSPTDCRTEEFVGAFSQVTGYPDLQVDSLRIAQCSGGLELEGKLPGVGYIDSLMAGEVIYTFHSVYDTSNSEGKPVAFRYLANGLEVIYFDFPLYFIQEPQATQLLHQALSDLGMSPTGVEVEEREVIASFSLKQNFPNPFNSETIIRYYLPRESQVRIDVYNILGQRVKRLLDQRETAGQKSITWDGKNDRGQEVSSGIYFYRIEAGKFVQSKKMLLLK